MYVYMYVSGHILTVYLVVVSHHICPTSSSICSTSFGDLSNHSW